MDLDRIRRREDCPGRGPGIIGNGCIADGDVSGIDDRRTADDP